MAFIIKCDPAPIIAGARVILRAPAYEGADPAAGEAVFLWFSESAGGAGLAGHGVVQAVSHDDPIDVAVLIEATEPTSAMRIEHLRGAGDDADRAPLAGLKRKLYRHSLNKVAELDEIEADYLRRRWSAPAASPRSRYDPLRDWLSSRSDAELNLSFADIEQILGAALPLSAARPQWWANTTKAHTNVQREAWRTAGYDAFLLRDQGRVRFIKTPTAG